MRVRREIKVDVQGIGAGPVAGRFEAPGETVLEFSIQPQEQTYWCWSAVAVSIAHYFDTTSKWTQCNLVNGEFNRSDCCSDGASDYCDKPWTLDTALGRTANLRDWYPVRFDALATEIREGRPVAARVAWRRGGAHVVVIDGYLGDDQETIAVSDPSPNPSSLMPLEQFASSYLGAGTCTHVYETEP